MPLTVKTRQTHQLNSNKDAKDRSNIIEQTSLFQESDSDEDRAETKSQLKGRATILRKVATKKIDMEKKIIDVALRKEKRAIRLFQYIEQCEREEKMNKLAKLSAHVVKQRKLLEEQTIQLNTKMKNQKLQEQKKKSDALALKRNLLLQIGRARTDKSYGSDHANLEEQDQDPHIFKSKFYDEQAQEMKSVRSKTKEQQMLFRQKRAELFQKFSAQKEEAEQALHVHVKQNHRLDVENELDRIIKKYTRPDSPVNLVSKTQKKLSSSEILLKAKADAKKKMQDNLKKNKIRTKQLTNGLKNHFGIVSSISHNFEKATLHARTLEDPVWEINKPEVVEDPNFNREPIEFILKSKRGPNSSLFGGGSSKSTLGSKKSQAFIGIDVIEPGQIEEATTTIEEDEVNSKKTKLLQNKVMTVEEASLLQKTTKMINDKTRFIQLRPKSSNVDGPSSKNNNLFSSQIPTPSQQDGSTSEDEDAKADILLQDDETSFFSNFGPDEKSSTRSAEKSLADKSSLVSFSPMKQQSIESTKSNSRYDTSLQPDSLPSKGSSSSGITAHLHTEVSHELRPSAYRQVSRKDMRNPFSRNLQLLKPDDQLEAPLRDWLQQINERKPTRKAAKAEVWPAISLEAVAEFGKTIYPKKLLSLANAAESEVKIAKSKKHLSRSRYPKKLTTLDHYYTERFEKDAGKSAFNQMPIMGEKLRYWPTELKFPKEQDLD